MVLYSSHKAVTTTVKSGLCQGLLLPPLLSFTEIHMHIDFVLPQKSVVTLCEENY